MGYVDSNGVYQVRPEDVEILPPENKSSRVDSAALAKLISNPGALRGMFSLTEVQALNVASLLTGAGAGLGRKYLTSTLGPVLSGAIGGALAGWLSGQILDKKHE